MSHCRMKVARYGIVVILLSTICGLAPSEGFGQKRDPTPRELARDIEKLRQKVRDDINGMRSAQAATTETVKEVRSKLDETGWKALDFASQLSSAQWTMFGTGLAILGLLSAVIAFGAYQGLLRMMRSNLDRAAARVEGRLTAAIKKEETRLQGEVDARIADLHKMMESSRQGVQARTFGLIAYAFWEQNDAVTGSTPTERDEKWRNLQSAIHLSDLALDCATKVGADPDAEALLTSIRSNRAFYIADLALLAKQDERFSARFTADYRKEAVSLANTVLPIATKEQDVRWSEWLESCCWVFWMLGGENQKRETLVRLRYIYLHKDVTDEMKLWIRKRYFENKEPVWRDA